MKVLLTKAFLKSDIEYIKARILPNIEIIEPQNYDELTLVSLTKEVDVLLGGLITEAILQEAKNLKFVQIPWTGVNNLDFDLIEKYNVQVCNSHSNSSIVAEHAIALMMAAAKKIIYHDELMRKGNWNRPGINENKINPFSKKISHSTIAIIGFGSIGKDIYRMMNGYKCHFKVFNRTAKQDQHIVSNNIQYCSINEVYEEIKDIDFIFITLPLTVATKGIIDTKFFNSMKKDSILVNVSRGEIIDEEALFNALKNEEIGCAAIDTWSQFPSKKNPIVLPSIKHEFHKLDNIILSPHRAGFIDSGFPHLDDAIENLNRAATGKPLINVVSIKDTY